MPIHDWTRVDANLFHDFHQTWTVMIRNALNGGLLPDGYSAVIDQHTGGIIPDVLAVEEQQGNDTPFPSGGAVVAVPPKTRHVLRGKNGILARRANRIAIEHPLGKVVCVIEIVSPGNKSSRAALDQFVQKCVGLLERGVHLLIVDLFPPTKRDPHGIHKAIWDEVEGKEPFKLPVKQRLILAAYCAGNARAGLATTAFVEPVGVGGTMPNMPAFLDPDNHVPVPLESTYQATWDSCPKKMRELVGERRGVSPT